MFDELKAIARMDKRVLTLQILNFLMVIASAYMIWKGLGLVTNTSSPIVVVLSESMSPAFEKGDILFLTLSKSPLRIGDIVVFELKGRPIPIVHRILELHEEKETGKHWVLTKGDNNAVHDRGLYHDANRSQDWLDEDDIVGRVSGYLPFVGYVTILMNDYPQFKIATLAILALYGIVNRENN